MASRARKMVQKVLETQETHSRIQLSPRQNDIFGESGENCTIPVPNLKKGKLEIIAYGLNTL